MLLQDTCYWHFSPDYLAYFSFCSCHKFWLNSGCARMHCHNLYFVLVQSLIHSWFFVTSGTATHEASLSFTISQSLLKLMSIELVMPSNYFILCHPLFLLPSIFPSLRVFSNESALWSNILVHLTRSFASQSIYTYIFLSGDYCFFWFVW